MLARLEQLPGVERPEVDGSGAFLRATIEPPADADELRAALAGLGYASDPASDADADDLRWYDTRTARQISRTQAEVLAAEVIAPFAQAHGLAPGTTSQLMAVARERLYEAFTGHDLGPGTAPAEFMRWPLEAIVADARELLPAPLADELREHLTRSRLGSRADGERT